MIFSKSDIAENLILGYVKTPLSLSEQALMTIALTLCHNINVKQCIFSPNLEIDDSSSAAQVRDQWDESLKKQSSEICKTLFLPNVLQKELVGLIRSIALQLLIWSGQWKVIFDISCEFTAHFWRPTHFTEGRIDERKIAESLMQDDRLSIDQRYMLACVYCLEEFIPLLWDQIPPEQRDLYILDEHLEVQNSKIVHVWSEYMRDPESFTTKEHFYWDIFKAAFKEMQATAMIFSWNNLQCKAKRNKLREFDYIFKSFDKIKKGNKLVLPFMNDATIWLPPSPSHGYIICFILSQIREQKIGGFEARLKNYQYIVKYFLGWPHE